MIRETLEIIPVAVIMALVLAFGLKAEQSPDTFATASVPQAERSVRMVEPVAAPPEVICPVAPEFVSVRILQPERDKRTGEIRMRPVFSYRHAPAPIPEQAAATTDGRIILNRASIEDLQRIPGIGLGKARVIVQQRPADGFGSWEELDAVPGVGHGTLEMIRLYADLS